VFPSGESNPAQGEVRTRDLPVGLEGTGVSVEGKRVCSTLKLHTTPRPWKGHILTDRLEGKIEIIWPLNIVMKSVVNAM
jgi:hypothetical protein